MWGETSRLCSHLELIYWKLEGRLIVQLRKVKSNFWLMLFFIFGLLSFWLIKTNIQHTEARMLAVDCAWVCKAKPAWKEGERHFRSKNLINPFSLWDMTYWVVENSKMQPVALDFSSGIGQRLLWWDWLIYTFKKCAKNRQQLYS